MSNQDILLESGTNEVEVAEVLLGEQHFGINVAKIREFRAYKGQEYQHLPDGPESVVGLFEFRGDTIPLVHLKSFLNLPPSEDSDQQIIVVTEFNNMTTGFITDGIEDIHRISWADFQALKESLAANVQRITGSVVVDKRRLLVLDMEQILGEIFPESVINYDETSFLDQPTLDDRSRAVIYFADDSTVIRTQLVKILREVGYREIRAFHNGRVALDAITEVNKKAQSEGRAIGDYIDLLISDIEMPQMDGLTLCREVKKNMGLKIPVIMFSSLITEQMAAKCREVGADAYVAKPETVRLIKLIDGFCCPNCKIN